MKQIPKSVKIGGLRYRVRILPKAELNEQARDRVFGMADHEQLVIALCNDATIESQWRTLFHEIAHILGGLQDEREAEVRSGLWHQVVVDMGLLS